MGISDWSSDVCPSDLWPRFKRVPDIGGEVARALGHFLDQPGNQQVIDQLLVRGVRIGDEREPNAKLGESLDLACLLDDLEIPKITPVRAAQLGSAFADAQAARKSVVWGKRGSVSVSLGGRRIIKKK